jgi:hypothetical protein
MAALALLSLATLGGCARGGASMQGVWPFSRDGAAPAAAAAAAAPADPLAAFAARARPGARESVTLADGQPATVSLARSYNAASGRECRELLVGSGLAERSRLFCATPGGGWAESRALLRGGGVGRP